MKSEIDNTQPTKAIKTKNLESTKIKNRQPEKKTKKIKAVNNTNSKLEFNYSCTNKQALEILIQSRTTYCRTIQISTRGVGLIVVSSLITARKHSTPSAFPLLPMYRVMLAFTEEKLALIYATKAMGLGDVSVYPLKPNADRVAALSTVTAFPKFATAYIEGLGIFTHKGIDFVPILPENQTKINSISKKIMLNPDPGNIILSNLREVVVSMYTPEMPAQCRKEFILGNPIPGATYDNKDFLKNADDIMPRNYNIDYLRYDIKQCNEFFEEHSKNWIGGCPSLKSPEGMPGVAVIQPRYMRIPYNCTVKDPCDYGIEFPSHDRIPMFSPIPLQTTEWLHGAACLYREPPENSSLYPYWNGSDEGSNPYSITANPVRIIEVLFNMEVLQSEETVL